MEHQPTGQGWVERQEWRAVRYRRRQQAVAVDASEAYLRTDVGCGSAACRVCPPRRPCLPAEADHIVLPDVEALVALLEVWELPSASNFLLLSSVLRQAADSRGNMRRAGRIRALYTDPRCRGAAFDNLHFLPTAPPHAELRRRGDLVRAGQWLAEHLGTPVVLLSDALFRTLGGGGSGDAVSGGPAKQGATTAQHASPGPGGSGKGGGSAATSNSAAAGTRSSWDQAERSSGHDVDSGMAASAAASSAAPTPSLADDGDDLLDELLAGKGGANSGSCPPFSSGAGSRPAVQQPPGSSSSSNTNSKAAPLPTARSTAISAVRPSAAAPRPAVNGSNGMDDNLLDHLLDSSEDDSKPSPSQPQTQAAHPAAALAPSSVATRAAPAGKPMQQRMLPAVRASQDDQSSDGDDLLDELFGSGLSLGPGGKPSAPVPAARPTLLPAAVSAPQRPPTAASSAVLSAQLTATRSAQPGQAASSRHPAAAAKQEPPPQPAAPAPVEPNDLLSELMADDEQHRELRGGRRATNGWRSRQPAAASDDGVQIAEGVTVMDAPLYFRTYWHDCAEVSDLFESLAAAAAGEDAAAGGNTEAGSRSAGFAPHLGAAALEAGLGSGTLLQGVIHMSRRGPREASVQVGSGGDTVARRILISGRAAVNRAVHGDIVAIRLLPRSQWLPAEPGRPPPGDADSSTLEAADGAEQENADPNADPNTEPTVPNPEAKDTSKSGHSLQPTGEVVGVLQRQAADVVACLTEQDEAALSGRTASRRQEAVIVTPFDRRLPRARLRTRRAAELVGQRFVVRFDAWPVGSQYPAAHLVSILGGLGDLQAEKEAILIGAGITRAPFPPDALGELPPPGEWAPSAADLATRRDLRSQLIASIDPPGCTDVDDALSAQRLADGRLQLGVHIADVSAFVRQGGALDREAAARGTTVYLTDERLDMLPERLSAGLASLLQGQDRPAVSVVWTLRGGDGGVEDIWFGRTIIRSRHQLSYQQAQDVADRQPPPPSFTPGQVAELRAMLDLLVSTTDAWRQRRLEAGALELESAELRFETSADGRDAEVARKRELPMMRTVAEAMIGANAAVAECIGGAFPAAALLRRHPPPRAEAFAEVESIMEAAGLQLDTSSNAALAASLSAVVAAAPETARLVRALATRAMSEAQYFSTGDAARFGGGGAGHFGLALGHYTHFTSPIRRYADLLVHRQLLAAVAGSTAGRKPPVEGGALVSAAAHLNDMTRAAKRAQRDCSDLYLLLSLHRKPHVEAAVVYGVQPDRLLVFVPEYHIRGSIRLCDAKGQPLAPAADVEAEAAGSSSDAYALAARRQLRLETGEGWARILADGDKVLLDVRAPQRVWLRLSADASHAHGPALRLRLLADAHPAAVAAAEAAAAAEAQAGSGSRSEAAADGTRGRKSGAAGSAASASVPAQGGGSPAQQAAPADAMADVFPWLVDEGPSSEPAPADAVAGGAASNGSYPQQRQRHQPDRAAPKQQSGTSSVSKGRRNQQQPLHASRGPVPAASLAEALQRALAMARAAAGPRALKVTKSGPGARMRLPLQPTKLWTAQARCSRQAALLARGCGRGPAAAARRRALQEAE